MATTSVQWLGINAVRFVHGDSVVLLDPYVTRNPNAASDPAYVGGLFPRADVIVVSHSHWDHLADVPTVARLTGATVVGSETTTNICRAYGVRGSQLVTLTADQQYSVGDFSVRLLPSLHVAPPGSKVAYAGTYSAPPRTPLRHEDYLEGGAFAPLLSFGEHKVLDISSANCVDEALVGVQCDLLLVSIARMEYTPRFLSRVLKRVHAKRIMPVHFDDFTKPLEAGLTVQPYVDVAEFWRQAHELAPEADIRVPDLLQTWVLD